MSGDTVKVATFNANSIRARLEQVLEWQQRESADVLCVQETKVQDADFPQDAFVEAGYHVIFRGQKAHAGVATISKEVPQEVSAGLDDGGEPDPARLLCAVYHGIPVINTYVPQGRDIESPHFQYKLEWLARLRDWFDRHYTPEQPLVWVGDFNVAPEEIDVHDPKRLKKHVDFHPDARAALERVREWGFEDVFRKHCPDEGQFTYWDYRVRGSLDRNLGWRIDHIWATAPLASQSTRAWIDVDARRAERPSDHTLVVAEFAL